MKTNYDVILETQIGKHLPQQIENFFNAYDQGNVELLERIKESIITIIPDGSFHQDLLDYDKSRKNNINNLMDLAIKTIKEQPQSKEPKDTIENINQGLSDLQNDLNTLEHEYWQIIAEYMVTYLNKEHGR